jgi:hypothetical protein
MSTPLRWNRNKRLAIPNQWWQSGSMWRDCRDVLIRSANSRFVGKPHLAACCSDRSRHTVAGAGFGNRDRFHSSGKIGLHRAAGFHRIGGRIMVHRECLRGSITLHSAAAFHSNQH